MTTHISLWYSIPPNKAPLKALFFSRFFEKDNEIKRRRIERECNQISASDRQMHYDLSKWKNDKWFWTTTTTKIKSDFIGLPFTDHFKYPRKKNKRVARTLLLSLLVIIGFLSFWFSLLNRNIFSLDLIVEAPKLPVNCCSSLFISDWRSE